MILIFHFFLRYFVGKNVRAMAIFPFIIVTDKAVKQNVSIINHEKIHWNQQIELLLLFFYIMYFCFYMFYRFKGMNHFNAYMAIPFEKEAYKNQYNLSYRKNRFLFAWLKFL